MTVLLLFMTHQDISRFRTLLWSAQHKLQSRSGMNIRDLFVKADIDGNGELDFEEFCEVIRVDLRLGMGTGAECANRISIFLVFFLGC